MRWRRRDFCLRAIGMGMLLCGMPGALLAVDGSGSIRFRGHMALGDSEGAFTRWEITRAVIDDDHPERSEVDVRVDLTSLDTGNAMRDRHLKSSDFLDVTRYPTATAKLHDVTVADPEHFQVDVDLDLHGVVRTFPMQLAVVDRGAREVSGEVILKRLDFQIGGLGSFLNPLRVDNDVVVVIDVIVPHATTIP